MISEECTVQLEMTKIFSNQKNKFSTRIFVYNLTSGFSLKNLFSVVF